MRIGFISTYPPIECGIATYTQYLTDALTKLHNEVYVVSHMGGNGKNVFPAFDYEDGDLAEKAFSMMMRLTPDIVHIQHEFGLFGKHFGVAVIPLIIKLRHAKVPLVTTFHTIYMDISKEHKIILESILLNTDYVIVHEDYQKQTLIRVFGEKFTDKVIVIPHGVREIENIQKAKSLIDLPRDKKVILLIGYFRPSKNFELIIDLMPEIIKRYKNAILVIAGKTRGKEHIEYRNMLFDRIKKSPVHENIYVFRGQIPQKTFDTMLSASDIVALPYKIISQSGIMAHCLSFEKPIVASGNKIMRSIIDKIGAGLTCNEPEDFVNNIVNLLSDSKLTKKLSQSAKNYVKKFASWKIVAQKHMEIYSRITRMPEFESNIIYVD